MKPHAQRTSLLIAAALLAGAATQPTLADGDRHYHKYRYEHPPAHKYYRYAPPPYYHQRRHNSNDDEKLLYGLLAGGLFGYVIGNAQQQYRYPGPSYAPPPQPRYQSYQSYEPASTCLQEREYQMRVIVGGKESQAYGTACLQPDGSWYRGPANVVSR
jgi:hypothetical protein